MATSAASAGTVVEHRPRSELLQHHALGDPTERDLPYQELDDSPMSNSSRNEGSDALLVKALDQ